MTQIQDVLCKIEKEYRKRHSMTRDQFLEIALQNRFSKRIWTSWVYKSERHVIPLQELEFFLSCCGYSIDIVEESKALNPIYTGRVEYEPD